MALSNGTRWMEMGSRALAELLPVEQQRFQQLDSAEKLERHVTRLKAALQPAALSRIIPRLDKVYRLSQNISSVVGFLAQGKSSVAATMWGFLGLSIEFTARDPEYLELVVRMFEDLLNSIPRYQSYAEVMEKNADLELAICDVYQEYVNLGLRTIKAFGRGNISVITKLKWKRDQKAFHATIRRLKKLKEAVSLEAAVVSMDIGQKRHEEILAAFARSEGTANSTQSHTRFHVPFLQNPAFYGREEYLAEIHSALAPQPTTAGSQLRFIVLCGLGGVGKTQLALEYLYKHKEDYQACFWVTCDTPVKTAQGYADIARKLKLADVGHVQIQALVKDWLCENEEDWLLVFDNAENARDLGDYWPPATNGAILLTSQNQHWLHQENVTHGIMVESFSTGEGVSVLRSIMQKHGKGISESAAVDVVKEVGSLPLAIRQIGSYIAATDTTPKEFLHRYQNRRVASNVDAWDEGGPLSYSHTLASVWKLALEKLSASAIFSLNCISLLDPDSILSDFFREDDDDDVVSQNFGSCIDYQAALLDLKRYSLVTQSSGNEGQITLSIHRQVRRHIQNRLASQDLQKAFDWTLSRLRKKFPQQSPFAEPLSGSWSQCELWISHLISVNTAAAEFKSSLVVPELLAQVLQDGAIYLWDGAYLHKVEVLNRRQHLMTLSERGAKPAMIDEIQLANAYNNYAGILCALDRYDEAELYNTLSLKLKERWEHQGDLGYLLSLTYSNIANVFGQRKKWDEAAEWYEKSLNLSSSLQYIPRRALAFHNYGCLRLSQGLVDDARDLLIEAVHLRTKKLGDHYDTASSLHMLASCYHRLKDLINARDLLREALRILEMPHHRDRKRVARSKYKLSLVLGELNESGAKDLESEAHRVRIEERPESNSDTDDEGAYDALVAYI